MHSRCQFSAFSSSPTSAAGRASPPSPQVPLTPRQPTLTLAIPFPDPPASCTSKNVPPFLLYSPLPAAHLPPEPGEKESLQKKAVRVIDPVSLKLANLTNRRELGKNTRGKPKIRCPRRGKTRHSNQSLLARYSSLRAKYWTTTALIMPTLKGF